ncbi:autoinducer binding domain-containing protein [Mesorhizobium shangrilense]|uniref:Autoinducer binding domain-containing protein n=1 Tax=Mesorhizobium shangrilense TaxID=460060 RepID=A0ABV2DMV7_9HYPH
MCENFVEQLYASVDAGDLCEPMASAAAGFDFPLFAYFIYPSVPGDAPRLISNYPSRWTSRYLQQRYHSLDPVFLRGLQGWGTLDWGVDRARQCLSTSQQQILESAAQFGIRGGLTMSMHDHSGRFAALTFASDESRPRLCGHSHVTKKHCSWWRSTFIPMCGAGSPTIAWSMA